MSAAPRWISPRTDQSTRGDEAIEFIETVCRITKDSFGGQVGELIQLRAWQRQLLRRLLVVGPDGRLDVRKALVMLPRKNGKSALGAGLALWQLVMGPAGGEVYSVAGDRDQARLVFGTAKSMVAMDPELSRLITQFKDALEVNATGSVYRVRSADAGLSEGLNPTCTIFDELHVQPSRELWDVMSLGQGGRPESLLLGITTAGVKADRFGRPTVCKALYDYGVEVATGEVVDASFFFCAWEPSDQNADWRDPTVWAEANPGLGDLISEDALAADARTTPENEFRTKHLDQWTSSVNAWLPAGTWEACESDDQPEPGVECVLAFDGSITNDSTALVLATIEETPRLRVLGLWERPTDDVHWRVPTEEVLDTIRQAAGEWRPREIVADPYLWRRELESLEDEGLPMVEFPQQAAHMAPATQLFYEAVVNQRLAHDGDPRLARHIRNARTKSDARGSRIVKENKNSPAKIDAAVCAVMAHDRAVRLLGEHETSPEVHDLNAVVRSYTPEKMAEIRQRALERNQRLLAGRAS